MKGSKMKQFMLGVVALQVFLEGVALPEAKTD